MHYSAGQKFLIPEMVLSAGIGCATMKLTTTTVKVCSTELNDSRSKGPVTDVCREAAPESTTVCLNWLAAMKMNPIQ
jgi:hypothetical protein